MKRVLIVEDVLEVRAMLSELVSRVEGVGSIASVPNGFEARIELERRKPDVVLLDELLPGESSLDLLRELQARQIAVILMTGSSGAERPLPEGARSRWLKPGWESFEAGRIELAAAIRRI